MHKNNHKNVDKPSYYQALFYDTNYTNQIVDKDCRYKTLYHGIQFFLVLYDWDLKVLNAANYKYFHSFYHRFLNGGLILNEG